MERSHLFLKRAGPSRKRDGAFTLIELLVVIAIIAVLASLLLPSSAVSVPSDMIAFGDSQSDGTNDFTISPIGLGESIAGNKRLILASVIKSSIANQAWPGNRHGRGANILFCDGHIEHDRQRNWLAQTPQARRRWNRDNDPHPETWAPVELDLLKYAD